ncbi:MAG: transporter [Porticoccaceae bacterium]|nr:MAG: transporter [Porticoccaceae bacterium]
MEEGRSSVHGSWASRWTFILAATGSAVGLGNIWKFPYIAGENGGGAFVLVYLLCVVLVGVPVMMAEVMLGRMGRASPVNAMKKITRQVGLHGFWNGIGWLGVVGGLLILSYYAVIAGWALYYVVEMASGRLQGATPAEAAGTFAALLADPGRLVFLQSAFLGLTLLVVVAGVSRGLGTAVRVMMPLLFALLVVLLGFAARQGDWQAGWDFLFSFRADHLTGAGVLTALGHSFFTLSLGMGAIMAYGAYMPERASITGTVLTIAVLDTLVALMAGMAIFPIVFASPGMSPDAGPSLLFQTLPVVFGNMPGGLLFGSLFFFLVTIAAWSSSISLLEPGVAWMIESWRVNRVVANLVLGALAWLLGLGTVFSFNWWSGATLAGGTFFDWIDFFTSSLLLPLTGLFIAVFVGWLMRPGTVFAAMGDDPRPLLRAWHWVLAWICPVAIFAIFAVGLYNKFH